MKALQKTLIGVASLALLGSGTAPAFATGAPTTVPQVAEAPALNASEYQEIRDFWNTYSVPTETQDRLMAGIQRGEPTQASRGLSEPVSTNKVEHEAAFVDVSTFADGSISVTTLEKPVVAAGGQMGTRSVTGCSYSGGSGYAVYNNCQVYQASDAVTTSFRASYQVVSSGASQINSYGTLSISVRGGKLLSGPSVARFVKASSQYQEAVVTHQASVGYTNLFGTVTSTETIYLSLRVPWGGGAYSTAY